MKLKRISQAAGIFALSVVSLILTTSKSLALFTVTWVSTSAPLIDNNYVTWNAFTWEFFVIGYREGWPEQWFIEVAGPSITLDKANKQILWHVRSLASYDWHTNTPINLQLTFLDAHGSAIYTSNTDFNFGTVCFLHQPYTQVLNGFPNDLTAVASVQLSFLGTRNVWTHNDNNDCQPGDNP